MNVNKKILRVLYITLVVIISLPALMFMLGIQIPGKALEGVVQDAVEPDLTVNSFYNHTYQFQLSNYLDSRFPFEASFIRLYNQIEFGLFHKINNKNVVLGKENVLFEPWYIDAYYGNDFLSEECIRDQVDKLAAIDSVFKENGKTLIIVLAPGKTNIYPEYIPDYLKSEETDQTNYQLYARCLKEKKMNLLDLNQWFINLKPTFERNLFPKAGTHWSEDMALVSLDTLVRFIECKSGNFLNNIILKELEHSQYPQGSDNDLLKISNLIDSDDYKDYYYWNYSFEKRFPVTKKLITISDSYFWNIYARGITWIFKDPQFWYYNKTAYFADQPEMPVSELDFEEQIKEADYILLMSSTSPLSNFGWGFIDEAFEKFVKNKADLISSERKANFDEDKTFQNSGCVSKEISEIIKKIKADPDWYQIIQEKAAEQDISVDSMLILDAIYMHDLNSP